MYWIKTKATKKLRKVYSGNWKKGQKSGLGVYYYPDKGRYEGNWENGMRQGQGTLFFANSDVYVGDWNEDRQSGFGTLTKENEDVYEGEWLNGKREGPGIYYYKSKQKIYDGEWVNDIPKCGIYTAASAFFDDTPDDASHPSDSDIDGRSAIDSRKKALKRMRKRLDPLPRLRLANPDEVLAVEIENIQRERQAVRNLPFMELEKLFSEQGLDDLRRIFSHYDANAAGCVDVLKLKEVMLELGFSISDPELAQLLVDLGKKAGEKVNFSEFVKAAHLIDNWKAKQEQDAEALARASMDTERNGGDEHEYYDYNAAMGTGL